MPRIAFIGAGSVEFSRKLLADVLSFPDLAGSTFALHDIDAERLETARIVAQATAEQVGVACTVEAHIDRRRAIDGADYVINMVQVGGHEATLRDFDVPERHGLRQTIADTLGVGGVFRALRTIPVLNAVADEICELCPDAWLLNYTNPMAMLCQAAYTCTPIDRIVGLCHSVQGTVSRIAGIVGVPADEVRFLSAGVNHQAHLLRIEHDGRDLYPLLDQAIERDPQLAGQLRVELYRRLGRYQTESSEHAGEYLPWLLRHDGEIDAFRLPIREYVTRSERNLRAYDEVRATALVGGDLPPLERSSEYAARIVNAIETDAPCVVYGNVRNDGLITNLPSGACVEVPCLVDGAGVQPTHVGDLPPTFAALNRSYLNVVELVVEAVRTQDPLLIRHAVMVDPNAAATLTMDDAWRMCDDLAAAHGDLLPAWARVPVRPRAAAAASPRAVVAAGA